MSDKIKTLSQAIPVYKKRGAPISKEFIRACCRVDKNGCWIWQRGKSEKGYASIKVGSTSTDRAHRVAFKLWHGPIPDGMLVCHHCDKPACCNPDHLFIGTVTDNNADKMRKGRHECGNVFGEKSGRSKLKEFEVRQVFNLYPKLLHREIAKLFGVSRSTIGSILNAINWRHLHGQNR